MGQNIFYGVKFFFAATTMQRRIAANCNKIIPARNHDRRTQLSITGFVQRKQAATSPANCDVRDGSALPPNAILSRNFVVRTPALVHDHNTLSGPDQKVGKVSSANNSKSTSLGFTPSNSPRFVFSYRVGALFNRQSTQYVVRGSNEQRAIAGKVGRQGHKKYVPWVSVDSLKKWPRKTTTAPYWIRFGVHKPAAVPFSPPPGPPPVAPESDVTRVLRIGAEQFVCTLLCLFRDRKKLSKTLQEQDVRASAQSWTMDDPKYSCTFAAMFQKGGPPAVSAVARKPYYKHTRIDADCVAQSLSGHAQYQKMQSVQKYLTLL